MNQEPKPPMPPVTVEEVRMEAAQKMMTKAAGEYCRLLLAQELTAAEQCLCFDDGSVWTLQLYRIPEDAVELMVKHAKAKELNQAGERQAP